MIRHHAAGLAGLAAFALLIAAPVRADDAAAEATYTNYHRAIVAAESCEKMEFSQADHEKMAGVIDEAIHYAIGAGRRLTLIEQVKSETRKLIDDKGCGEASVQDALALFHRDLEPALQ